MARVANVAYRVSSTQEILLKVTAVTLDAIGFFLTLTVAGEVGTEIIGLMGDILLAVWFFFLGANLFEGRSSSKVLTLAGNAVVEVLPFINGIYPGFSIAVWRMTHIVKEEDEEKARREAKRRAMVDAAELRRVAILRARRLQAANDTVEQASTEAA